MEYKASIIIPVFNAEKTLRRCVESLLLGQERSVQVILVEDRSADQSWAECLRLRDEYEQVTCIQNAVNSGVSFTRNQGVGLARAEWILFVDSDDWVSEHYVSRMLRLAESHLQQLPVCGYTFIDHCKRFRTIYQDNQEAEQDTVRTVSNLFELEKKVLMQQLWNKAFRREVIVQSGIRFDESLSMGEDFQFVLDYMRAADIHECAVLNMPLYYYIRANQTSLMSKWIEESFELRLNRYAEMAALMDDAELRKKELFNLEARLKRNALYHTVAAPISRKQKKRMIAQYVHDANDAEIYRNARTAVAKERLLLFITQGKRLFPRLAARIKREYIEPRRVARRRTRLRARDFTLICQNCIGGVFYHEMGMQFLSPTINCFIEEPGFMKFVGNLEHYLALEPDMRWGEEYPIGDLDDVRIDFMHFDTCAQAREAWQRRKARVRLDRVVVIATDRNGFDDACFEQWKKLPYRKILYTANPAYASEPGTVVFEEYAGQACVGNIIDHKQFFKDDVIFDVINSLDHQ